jgi:hypothetical protein
MTNPPRTVAALYIRRGHYPRMTGVECYDVRARCEAVHRTASGRRAIRRAGHGDA